MNDRNGWMDGMNGWNGWWERMDGKAGWIWTAVAY